MPQQVHSGAPPAGLAAVSGGRRVGSRSASSAIATRSPPAGTARGAQGSFKFHQYQVVGRHLPTEAEPAPTVYRMKVWAEDTVKAKSKFW
jgi:hypothetical protein